MANILIKKKIFITLFVLIFISAAIFVWSLSNRQNPENINKIKAAVFKSPTCGCCEDYIDYLGSQGFQVETVETKDMLSIKQKYNIPSEMESCHTVVIGDYFIEGHVPIETIKKLLEEKPDIEGIALPGMPSGSPGMGGKKLGDFIIYSLSKGKISEFMRF